MIDKQPDSLTAGRVFNTIEQELSPEQASLLHALPFNEQVRIMDLKAEAREAAIAALTAKTKTAPAAKEVK